MLNKLTLKDLDVVGKRVLVRVDFNLPVDERGEIIDDTRIVVSLPTINYILENGGSCILISHFGRPDGRIEESLRLTAAGKRLSELLGRAVKKTSDCIGEETKKVCRELKGGEVVLLENVRFHTEEDENDLLFAKELGSLGDLYINDAFSVIHREHASVCAICRVVQKAAAGFLLEKEVEYMTKVLESKEKPLIAILGGAKVSTKIDLIKNLLSRVDELLIGGGMAYTFFAALGIPVGKSIVEKEHINMAKEILLQSIALEKPIYLPSDHVVATFVSEGADITIVGRGSIPGNQRAVDIGPQTIEKFSKVLRKAKCIFWNGPMGVFEIERFSKGTLEMAKVLGESNATTIVGGGDSVAAVVKLGLADKMTHISTGGGACLEFLGGAKMPGLSALTNK
ncbi:MAG: phosphoglycerate kinase [bacterium]